MQSIVTRPKNRNGSSWNFRAIANSTVGTNKMASGTAGSIPMKLITLGLVAFRLRASGSEHLLSAGLLVPPD